MGIRDIRSILAVRCHTIYKVIRSLVTDCKPRKTHYGTLEVDEFWTYVRSKKRKKWLIHTYDRQEGESVAYVWGKRSEKTARKLREMLLKMGIRYDHIATDNWNSFAKVFSKDSHQRGEF